MTRRRILSAVAAALIITGGVTTAVVLRSNSDQQGRDQARREFLAAWARDDWTAMTAMSQGHPPELRAVQKQLVDNLGVTRTQLTTGSGDVVHVSLTLGGLGVWRYDTKVRLHRGGGGWLVAWSPATSQPALAPGLHLARVRNVPPRAAILASDGTPLASDGPTVAVGLEPRRIKDTASTLKALAAVIPVDQTSVSAALSQGPKPDAFVPVTELERHRFDALRPQLEPIPGVVFQARTGRVVADGAFGAATLGRTGPVTAEELDRMGPSVEAGDRVGQSGLEAAFQARLAGRASGEVDLADAAGKVRKVLVQFAATDPAPVATTLDLAVQDAAEKSLAGVSQPAAVVALDASTGELRAVVSHPADQSFNRALAGRYPPGSTFKVITTAALLRHGVTPGQPVACPQSINVGGKLFTNIAGEGGTTGTFSDAFALSCNTAFVGLARQLPADALTASAPDFGLGVPGVDLGLTAVSGVVPPPADPVEQVADAIGQGRVTASPLAMAEVAATVAAGTWHPPILVRELTPPPAPRSLDPAIAAQLRQLMALVVQKGTGRAAAAGGSGVAGKTGTAEFGPGNPPQTHAWFIGFRGSLAFAVLVEGGGVGGQVAAPIAARFLAALPPA